MLLVTKPAAEAGLIGFCESIGLAG